MFVSLQDGNTTPAVGPHELAGREGGCGGRGERVRGKEKMRYLSGACVVANQMVIQ